MTIAREHKHPPGHVARILPDARDFCPVPGCPLNPGSVLRVAVPGPVAIVNEYQNVRLGLTWSWERTR
jgi:hypothetical protein